MVTIYYYFFIFFEGIQATISNNEEIVKLFIYVNLGSSFTLHIVGGPTKGQYLWALTLNSVDTFVQISGNKLGLGLLERVNQNPCSNQQS